MTESFLNNDAFLLTCTLLVPGLPLLSFALSWLTSERYGWLVGLNAPVLLFFSTICSVVVLFSQWNSAEQILQVDWFTVGKHVFSANVALSNTSVVMMTIVAGVSFLVHVFSIGYMVRDPQQRKYFAMLGFFTFSMQGVVLADNLVLLFFFWELVGFSSYMLIGHWTEIPAAGSAAKKAFIVNRIGDAAFLLGVLMIWTQTGSVEISVLKPAVQPWATTASLLVFGGVIGKSAQFPLFTWLPDAMQGPTPVSALIHAATMVAAGVYLCIRVFPLFTPDALFIMTCTGMTTAFIGALAALYQFDIKRVLAFSTVSQLGLMIMAIGLGVVNAALLHLFTHAFFKACLFLCAGSVIHALHESQQRRHDHFDPQDIRNMGGLRTKLPQTFFAFSLAAASLAGIPFFSGFLSKEAILSAAAAGDGVSSWVFLFGMLAVSFLTVLYCFRLAWYVFFGESRLPSGVTVSEVPMIMRLPVIILGSLSLWFVVSWNPFDAVGWLTPPHALSHFPGLTVFTSVWVLIALVVGYSVFKRASFYRNALLENGFFIDSFYGSTIRPLVEFTARKTEFLDQRIIDRFIHMLAYLHMIFAHMIGWVDRVIVDGVVNALSTTARIIGSFTRSFQGGKVQLYIFWSVFGLIIFLIWTLK